MRYSYQRYGQPVSQVATIAGMCDSVRRSRFRWWSAVPAALAFGLIVAQAALPWTAKHFVTQDGPSHLYNAMVAKDLALEPHSFYAAVYAIQRNFVSNWGTVVVFNGLVFFVWRAACGTGYGDHMRGSRLPQLGVLYPIA